MPDQETDSTWTGSLACRVTDDGRGPPVPPRTPLDPFPERIGPYVTEELVGRGGMAAVYRCRDPNGELVAVKWLHHPSPSLAQRFAREIRSLSRLDHPGVVRYLGHGEHAGRAYLVMEYLEGEDLRLLAMKLRNLPTLERYQRVRALAIHLAEALAYIHGEGLIHRDVKPSNVRVLDGDACVLTDFGIVKDLADDGHTATGVVLGTLHYASPEQLRGDSVDARADLYGLGCTLYTVLANQRPFNTEDQAGLMRAHLQQAPTPLSSIDPTVPADLEAIVLRLMAKRPEDRMASAEEVIQALSLAQPPEGVALAGRKGAVDKLVVALDRVAAGRGTLVRIVGAPGTGRSWLIRMALDGARRRDLQAVHAAEPGSLEAALARLARGEHLLVLTTLPVPRPDAVLRLRPLGPGDVRRSVVANARGVREPARVAERLFRATGGLPALLVPFLRRLHEDPQALEHRLPGASVDPWLDGLDLDTLEILQALAAARGPMSPTLLEEITQVPAEEPLDILVDRGLVREITAGPEDDEVPRTRDDGGLPLAGPAQVARVNRRYVVSAGLFAEAALARVPDPDALDRRVGEILARHSTVTAPDSTAWQDWENRLKGAVAVGFAPRAAEARALIEVLVREAEQAGETGRLGRASTALGILALHQGQLVEADNHFKVAFSLTPDHAETVGASFHGRAVVAFLQGDPARAADSAQDAVSAFKRGRLPSCEAASSLFLAMVLGLSRREGRGIKAAERALTLAQALPDPQLECWSMRYQGIIHLDMRRVEEASRVLADVTALAHAARLPADRWIAHLCRAQVSLDAQPGVRTAAAAAMERLMRVLAEKSLPDSEPWRAYGLGLLARAAAIGGNARAFARAEATATSLLTSGLASDGLRPDQPPALALSVPQPPMAVRTRLQLARAWWVAGKPDAALTALDLAEAECEARGFTTLLAEVGWLRARIGGHRGATGPEALPMGHSGEPVPAFP